MMCPECGSSYLMFWSFKFCPWCGCALPRHVQNPKNPTQDDPRERGGRSFYATEFRIPESVHPEELVFVGWY